MNRAAVISLFALACSAFAQVKEFKLGALREDVIKEFGSTERFFAPMPSQYLIGLVEYRAALGVWARIDDVYMRETPTNAYEVHLMYHLDSRESRLRPKQRVGRVEFTVDKPKDFKETLAELPEAKSVCKGGCSLYGMVKYGSAQILAYPTHPAPDLLALGSEVATGFKESDPERTWGIGILLKLEGRRSRLETAPPDWNGKITQIELSPASLQYELTSLASSSPRLVELGTWQPN